MQSSKLLDNILIAYYRMSEANVFSYQQYDKEYRKQEDRRNDNYGQYGKYPVKYAEINGVIAEYFYVFTYVEYLYQSVP